MSRISILKLFASIAMLALIYKAQQIPTWMRLTVPTLPEGELFETQ